MHLKSGIIVFLQMSFQAKQAFEHGSIPSLHVCFTFRFANAMYLQDSEYKTCYMCRVYPCISSYSCLQAHDQVLGLLGCNLEIVRGCHVELGLQTLTFEMWHLQAHGLMLLPVASSVCFALLQLSADYIASLKTKVYATFLVCRHGKYLLRGLWKSG